MAITLRSQREIELMRKAGAVVADVLSKLKRKVEPGVSTAELNAVALEMTESVGAQPLFKGVKNPCARFPFPGAVCTSINEQIVHGIPSEKVKLREGDLVSLDFGARLNEYCGDSAISIGIEPVSEVKLRLLEVTRRALEIAIENAGPGQKWSTVADKMERYVRQTGFSVVREFVGHGIGREMHEEPRVPNFVSRELLQNDIILKEGMVLAVEPMVNAGTYATRTLDDGWTVVTKDGSCSAHFEHTIAIVKNGCLVLTGAA